MLMKLIVCLLGIVAALPVDKRHFLRFLELSELLQDTTEGCIIRECTENKFEMDGTGLTWLKVCYHCIENQIPVLFKREDTHHGWTYVTSKDLGTSEYGYRIVEHITNCQNTYYELDGQGREWRKWCYQDGEQVLFQKNEQAEWTYLEDYDGGIPSYGWRKVVSRVFPIMLQEDQEEQSYISGLERAEDHLDHIGEDLQDVLQEQVKELDKELIETLEEQAEDIKIELEETLEEQSKQLELELEQTLHTQAAALEDQGEQVQQEIKLALEKAGQELQKELKQTLEQQGEELQIELKETLEQQGEDLVNELEEVLEEELEEALEVDLEDDLLETDLENDLLEVDLGDDLLETDLGDDLLETDLEDDLPVDLGDDLSEDLEDDLLEDSAFLEYEDIDDAFFELRDVDEEEFSEFIEISDEYIGADWESVMYTVTEEYVTSNRPRMNYKRHTKYSSSQPILKQFNKVNRDDIAEKELQTQDKEDHNHTDDIPCLCDNIQIQDNTTVEGQKIVEPITVTELEEAEEIRESTEEELEIEIDESEELFEKIEPIDLIESVEILALPESTEPIDLIKPGETLELTESSTSQYSVSELPSSPSDSSIESLHKLLLSDSHPSSICHILEGDISGRYFWQQYDDSGNPILFQKDTQGNFIWDSSTSSRLLPRANNFLEIHPKYTSNTSQLPACALYNSLGKQLDFEKDDLYSFFWEIIMDHSIPITFSRATSTEVSQGMYRIDATTGLRMREFNSK